MNYVDLSKTMSYALRHHPEQFGLVLDEKGFVDIKALVKGIALTGFKYAELTANDIINVVNNPGPKQRYEIVGDKIRAFYGHSTSTKIEKVPVQPPVKLYHGTTLDAWKSIEKTGLQPMGRQYVHLSADVETAVKVAKRRTKDPIILIIDAESAWKAGVKFYTEPNGIWLSEPISDLYIAYLKVDYIELLS